MMRSMSCLHMGQRCTPSRRCAAQRRHTHRCEVLPCRKPTCRGPDQQMVHVAPADASSPPLLLPASASPSPPPPSASTPDSTKPREARPLLAWGSWSTWRRCVLAAAAAAAAASRCAGGPAQPGGGLLEANAGPKLCV